MFFSPKTSADGLVFHYDTGNTVRSYLGEPTSNLVTNGNFNNSKTGWSFTNVANSATSVGTYQGRNALFANGLKYYNESPGYFYQSISVTQGVQYTISFKYYLLSGTLVFDPDGAYNGGGGLTQSGQWVNYSVTFTASTTSLTLNFYGASGVLAYYYITDIQLEAKSHATPFTTGTRSATQGLKDLTAKSTIDISTVSFDSNAQMTFDGTDDEINTGITTQLTDFSCEVVFKNNNSEAWGRLVDKSYTDGFFISAYFATSGIGYVGAGIIEPSPPHGQALQYDTSKYNYFVVTRSGTTHTIYLNGSTNSLSKTGSSTALSTAEMAIGAYSGTYNSQRFTGEIPVVKLYNRALTTNEVARNFNAIKSRFNIG